MTAGLPRTASDINGSAITGPIASAHPKVRAVWITRTVRRLKVAKDVLDA
jgi:hypothetical protein